MFESLNINLTSDINLSSEINSVLKKIFNEEAEISIETDAETATNFEEEADLTKKLA